MKFNTKENIIKYLLSLEPIYCDRGIRVEISRKKFGKSPICDIGETEFCKQLELLKAEGLIDISYPTPHRNLDYYITITLSEKVINYFQHQKEERVANKNQWIQFWIPVTLSVVALALSAAAFYLEYFC